jgi:hypothetical protein
VARVDDAPLYDRYEILRAATAAALRALLGVGC